MTRINSSLNEKDNQSKQTTHKSKKKERKKTKLNSLLFSAIGFHLLFQPNVTVTEKEFTLSRTGKNKQPFPLISLMGQLSHRLHKV